MTHATDVVLKGASGKGAGKRGLNWSLLARFVRDFVRGHGGAITVAVVSMSLYAGSVTALPALFERLVNDIFVRKEAGGLVNLIWIVVVLFAIRATAGFAQQYLLARVGNQVATDVQRRFADHVLSLDLVFFQRNSLGQIVARGTEDVNVLNQSAIGVMVVLVRDLASFIGLLAYVIWTNPQWFAVVVAGGPLIAIPTALATQRIRKLAKRGQQLNGDLIGAFEEGFHGIRGIKAEGNEGVERARLTDTIVARRRVQLKGVSLQALLMPLLDVVTALALVGVLIVGGGAVMRGEAQPGELMAFVAALMLLYDPMRRLLQTNAQLQTAVSAIERIYEVLDMRPAIVDRPGAGELTNPQGEIAFEGVTFSYDASGGAALQDFSVTIPSGATVAFVGPSGAGKTTVLNLVARLYEPAQGSVRIGGQDIATVRLDSLRRHLALVAQDALLYDATIAENIAYGRPDASPESIRQAARDAQAEDFIERLPGGYDFRVGPRGTRLSGGQRQRLVVARALLRDAPILLLDEATSALDADTEARLLASLARLRAGRTTLVIAHRLSTVTGADLICFVEGGRIVEQGTHAALLAQNGAYARAWQQQIHSPDPASPQS